MVLLIRVRRAVFAPGDRAREHQTVDCDLGVAAIAGASRELIWRYYICRRVILLTALIACALPF